MLFEIVFQCKTALCGPHHGGHHSATGIREACDILQRSVLALVFFSPGMRSQRSNLPGGLPQKTYRMTSKNIFEHLLKNANIEIGVTFYKEMHALDMGFNDMITDCRFNNHNSCTGSPILIIFVIIQFIRKCNF